MPSSCYVTNNFVTASSGTPENHNLSFTPVVFPLGTLDPWGQN